MSRSFSFVLVLIIAITSLNIDTYAQENNIDAPIVESLEESSEAASEPSSDSEGKKLKSGTDYYNDFTYRYKDLTIVTNNGSSVTRLANEIVDPIDIIPVGTTLIVEVRGRNNYNEFVSTEYRLIGESIASASVTVPAQFYTGYAIEPGADSLIVEFKRPYKKLNAGEDFEIIDYSNNYKTGTATLTLHGINNYGGTKIVKFSIKARTFIWWWK